MALNLTDDNDTNWSNRREKLRWYKCDRCGFQYPESKMIVQVGIVVCNGVDTNNCRDEPGYSAAYRLIQVPTERYNPPLPNDDEFL
jgi:hypothetical protein